MLYFISCFQCARLLKPGEDHNEVIWDVDADAKYNIKI